MNKQRQQSVTAGSSPETEFVRSFRLSSPYIHAHRGRVMVIALGGEAIAAPNLKDIIHDIALLISLGIRIVVVFGARPQIDQRLAARGAAIHYENGLRITDAAALECVKEAVGSVRAELEGRFSVGLANTPAAASPLRVVSGNFVTAHPLGVRNGIDYQHTGEIRRVRAEAIEAHLAAGDLVMLPPLGYASTGEVFNLYGEDVATAAAMALKADKLIFLTDPEHLPHRDGSLLRQMGVEEAAGRTGSGPAIGERLLRSAVTAGRSGVRRIHLLDRTLDGSLLLELFTRDGAGTLIAADRYDDLRDARIEDVSGILELIAPLEAEGVLVPRTRENLETEIENYVVMERDGSLIACGALYPYAAERTGELVALAVDPAYRNAGRGEAILDQIEARALNLGLTRLIALSTRTSHWFLERGFRESTVEDLPIDRQRLYNVQRRSKVFVKEI